MNKIKQMNNKFKVGDVVKVKHIILGDGENKTDNFTTYLNKIGEIKELTDDSKYIYQTLFEDRFICRFCEVELVKATPKEKELYLQRKVEREI